MAVEQVILVDETDTPVGTMEKIEAHQKALLHRAFSVFVFNSKGDMLIQRRAPGKYHSPGLWTNACCSHPRPGEDTRDAALRRLREELGFSTPIEKSFDFIYRTEFGNGLTEYEFDHVFIGYYDGVVRPDATEVSDYTFRSPDDIRADLAIVPDHFTAWFHLAFPLVAAARATSASSALRRQSDGPSPH